jgi:ribonuclease HI
MAKKIKFYVVWKGKNPGIYKSWAECLEQVKGFNGASFKSFTSIKEAEAAFQLPLTSKKSYSSFIKDSIAVDAACSGNPGVMEYQGVDVNTGKKIFHKKFNWGTNNIGEFLAIVHALALLKTIHSNKPIYSDSKIAMLWVKNKKCNTKLDHTKSEDLIELIQRAEVWLRNNSYENKILKWETEVWGEIPADFGRK